MGGDAQHGQRRYIFHGGYNRDELEFISSSPATGRCPACLDLINEVLMITRRPATLRTRLDIVMEPHTRFCALPCGCYLRSPIQYRIGPDGAIYNLRQAPRTGAHEESEHR